MNDHDEIIDILIAALAAHYGGTPLSTAQQRALEGWLVARPENAAFYEKLSNAHNFSESIASLRHARAASRQELTRQLFPQPSPRIVRIGAIKMASIAASLILLISFSWFTFLRLSKKPVPGHVAATTHTIHPTRTANLVLATGQVIPLTDTSVTIPSQGTTQVTQPAPGVLAYLTDSTSSTDHTPLYNTITTPPGGYYKVILPDHSVAWLNAESKLRFPASFTASIRTVEAVGEVYFEVEKSTKPFIVTVQNGQGQQTSITVLGTKFNVDAYVENGAVTTTLVEGKVRIGKNGVPSKELTPGQQSRVSFDSSPITVATGADVEAITSWTTGIYIFRENLNSVIKKLGRCYNVPVVFHGQIPDSEFVGRINRTTPLGEVMELLKAGGANVKLENGRINVYP